MRLQSSTEDELQTRYQSLPGELKNLIIQAFLEACLKPGHVYLNQDGNLLSTSEYQAHPSARGYARPEVIKCLLAMPRSDFDTTQQTLYSHNTWNLPDHLFVEYRSRLLVRFARHPWVNSVQLVFSDQEIPWFLRIEHLRRPFSLSPAPNFVPWTAPTSRVSGGALHNGEIYVWLKYMDSILRLCQIQHLIIVIKDLETVERLRRETLSVDPWEGWNSHRQLSAKFGVDTQNGRDRLWAIVHTTDCEICKEGLGSPS